MNDNTPSPNYSFAGPDFQNTNQMRRRRNPMMPDSPSLGFATTQFMPRGASGFSPQGSQMPVLPPGLAMLQAQGRFPAGQSRYPMGFGQGITYPQGQPAFQPGALRGVTPMQTPPAASPSTNLSAQSNALTWYLNNMNAADPRRYGQRGRYIS